MAKKYARYRGQRFVVAKEDDKFVTLEGFGYAKKHLKDEVIFEEQPEDTLAPTYEDKSEIQPIVGVDEVADLPRHRQDLDMIHKKLELESQNPVFEPRNMEDDLVDQGGPEYNKSHEPQLTNREHKQASTARTMPLAVPKSDPNLQLAQEAGVPAPVDPSEAVEGSTPTIEGSSDYPKYPKIGLDLSVLGTDQRHSENEKRRKDALALFKEKLQGMLAEVDAMDMSEMAGGNDLDSAQHAIVSPNMTEESTEGVDMPYETFDQFMEDFLAFAKAHDFISPEKQIDVDQAVMNFSGDKHAAEMIKKLGGLGKVGEVLKKKVAEVGLVPAEGQLAESLPPVTAPVGSAMPANDGDAALQSKLGGPIAPATPLTEDGAAAASAGGGVPGANGAVDVASTTGPATSTANVANFNARLGAKPQKRLEEEQK